MNLHPDQFAEQLGEFEDAYGLRFTNTGLHLPNGEVFPATRHDVTNVREGTIAASSALYDEKGNRFSIHIHRRPIVDVVDRMSTPLGFMSVNGAMPAYHFDPREPDQYPDQLADRIGGMGMAGPKDMEKNLKYLGYVHGQAQRTGTPHHVTSYTFPPMPGAKGTHPLGEAGYDFDRRMIL